VEDVTAQAREAYAEGWAASGGPMTARVKAGCVAAVDMARAHHSDPQVFEVTLRLGHLEGTWARVYERRDSLHANTRQAVGAVWRKAAAKADIGRQVRRYRRLLGVSEAQSDDDYRKLAAKMIAAGIVGDIAGTGSEDRDTLVAEVADALRQAQAEGYTGTLAVGADAAGATGFDYDQAYQDAYGRLATVDLARDARRDIDIIVSGVATDLAGMLDGLPDDVSYDDTVDAVDGFLDGNGDGYPAGLGLLLDYALGFGLTAGAMDLFGRFGITLIAFTTASDDRVCPECDQNEANGPYLPADVPGCPVHPNCRCSLEPADIIPADAYFEYV